MRRSPRRQRTSPSESQRIYYAGFQQLAIDYQQTVLEANQEIESALINFLKAQERLQDVRELVETTKKTVDIGIAQYRVGATDFNRVSNLQLALVDAQNLLATSKGEAAQSLIAVYKAIGGGWQIRLDPTAPQGEIELLQRAAPLEEAPEPTIDRPERLPAAPNAVKDFGPPLPRRAADQRGRGLR